MLVYTLDGEIIVERDFYSEHLTYSVPHWTPDNTVLYTVSSEGDIVVENIKNWLISRTRINHIAVKSCRLVTPW